jgi:hypothetical protein
VEVGHPITNGPATFGLDVDIDNEPLFEKIVIGFAYLMLCNGTRAESAKLWVHPGDER